MSRAAKARIGVWNQMIAPGVRNGSETDGQRLERRKRRCGLSRIQKPHYVALRLVFQQSPIADGPRGAKTVGPPKQEAQRHVIIGKTGFQPPAADETDIGLLHFLHVPRILAKANCGATRVAVTHRWNAQPQTRPENQLLDRLTGVALWANHCGASARRYDAVSATC